MKKILHIIYYKKKFSSTTLNTLMKKILPFIYYKKKFSSFPGHRILGLDL